MPPEIKPKTPLSFEIHAQMKKKGISAHELANSTGVVYETIRGVVKGDRPPGKQLLREICRTLGLDFAATNRILVSEQIKRKFGYVPSLMTRDADLQTVEDLWPLLLPEEKEHIRWLVANLAEKRGRKVERSAAAQRIAPRPVRTP